jgi:uncharacterized integral membrane protein (TIGR00698 family)
LRHRLEAEFLRRGCVTGIALKVKEPPIPGRVEFTLHSQILRLAPGLAFSAAIAALAIMASGSLFAGAVSPLFIAMGLGIVYRNLAGTPSAIVPGLKFGLRRILRAGVMLLGLQLTISQIVEVQLTGVAIIAVTLVATFLFTVWIGRTLGVDRKLTELIAAGTSICGASAIIATNTVTKASDEDVTYAVACVTIFGSISMFVYPLLPGLLLLAPQAYGLWAGASIHEVAQVVAAAFQDGEAAGHMGTVAKLSRVIMLAPAVVALSVLAARRNRSVVVGAESPGTPLPYFVLGFVAFVVVNSFTAIPPAVTALTTPLTVFFLSLSLAAMGLETDLRKLKARGMAPIMLGAASGLFIALFSLALIKLTG